jgi:hypothetical protein
MTRHVTVAAGFVVLAVLWTLPLSLHLSTHLPGEAIGDNAVFLWNFWWMRHALATHSGFFHTNYLFAPVGTSLTLHTHTALPAFLGATLLGAVPLVAAVNIVTLAALALNGFCAYVLAWRATHDRAAAIVAGVIFGCSPFIAAHLTGHFNLIHAWTIPLFALVWLGAMQGNARAALAAGALLGATGYIDYYFVVFEIAFAVCTYVMHTWRWSASEQPLRGIWKSAFVVLATLIALDLIVIAAISTTGGFTWRIASRDITARGVFNPMQALGLLVVAAACVYARPSVRAVGDPRVRALRASVWAVAGFAVLVAPLAFDVARMVVNGDYVSPLYYWRSAPPGIDVATLLVGNPFHGLWGSAVRGVYACLSIDAVESVAWLGVIPVLLTIYALRRRSHDGFVRRWLAIAAIFFIWSLGSHMFVAGRNTGLLAPGAVLRFIPIVANARMPGRAMVVVYLAVAMLGALGVADYRMRNRGVAEPALVLALILLEFFAAPFPVSPVGCSSIYDTLRARPEHGAVVELPLAFGDGFGSVTPADNRTMLACQTVHERPLVGGFAARLSPRVVAAYRADPLLAALLRLSDATGFEGAPLPARDQASDRLRADSVAFIVLDRAHASEALRRYVENELTVEKIAEDGARVMFATR